MKKPAKRAHVKPHKRPAKKTSAARKKPAAHTVKRAAKKPAKRAAKRAAVPKRKVGKAKASPALMSGHRYDPDPLDPRDHIYRPSSRHPTFVDLEPAMPPVWDQGDDSCVAHACLAVAMYAAPERHADPTLPHDGPTGEIREVVKACAAGAEYLSVRVADLPACLSDGQPVVFGITIHESFTSVEAEVSGVVPMPGLTEVVGPHCMVAVGYGWGYEWAEQYPTASPMVRYVKVRNSWGPGFHVDGHALMPLAYIEQHGADLWAIAA